MEMICAFSSDSRELYKADIYRVLALPYGHIVHFRYKRKYVDESFLKPEANFEDKKLIIFFTYGNTAAALGFGSISIREAIITKIELSSDTDVFHVFMRLDRFCNYLIDPANDKSLQPPIKFFTRLTCSPQQWGQSWHNRIDAMKDYFPRITFFHLKEIRDKCGPIQISYDGFKGCHFELTHGNRYTLQLAVANPYISDTKIEISDASQELIVNCINPLESSIQFDDHEIPIFVKSLQFYKQASLLQFKPTLKRTSDDEYEVLGEYSTNIELSLKRGYLRSFWFGTFSTSALWAILLITPRAHGAEWGSTAEGFFASLLFFISSAVLFYWFDKK